MYNFCSVRKTFCYLMALAPWTNLKSFLETDRPAAISYQRSIEPKFKLSKLWSTSALPDTQGIEHCISCIIIICYLPVFKSLYERFERDFNQSEDG